MIDDNYVNVMTTSSSNRAVVGQWVKCQFWVRNKVNTMGIF